jgi:hypothetical protein
VSYTAQDQAIRTRFRSQWSGETPISWPNEEFRPPNPPAPWVRLRVMDFDAEQADIAGALSTYRHTGDVVVEVFVPLGSGEFRAKELAQKVQDVFRGWQSGGMRFYTPRAVPVGKSEEIWWKINVLARFERDSVFA